LIRSLSLLDPLLQFLTRATGQTVVSLSNLQSTIPKQQSTSKLIPFDDLMTLLEYGIIQIQATAIREQAEEGNNIQTNCWKADLKNEWNQECTVSAGDASPVESSRNKFENELNFQCCTLKPCLY